MTTIRLALILFSLSLLNPLPAQPQPQPQSQLKFRTMGLDMEILGYGGSLGGFYSFHFNEAMSLDLEMDWSLIESNDTFAYYDYYNRPVSINNRNLSFVKLLAGTTWFPFLETMHASLQVGGFVASGPVFALNTADDEALLDRWQHVETDVAPMVRGGIHLRVLTGQAASYNFRLGYDYIAFDQVIDSRQIYKGLFFQAAMEFQHR